MKAKTKTVKMVKKYKTLWLKALRSGKYKQGIGTLKKMVKSYYAGNETETALYCCLGVLQECTGFVPMRGYTSKRSELSKTTARKFGLKDQSTLIDMNDRYGYSFKRIANWIEKNL